MRKRVFRICEKKAQISAFVNATLIVQSPEIKPLAIFYGCTAWFVSDLVENLEDRFSLDVAHIRHKAMSYTEVTELFSCFAQQIY